MEIEENVGFELGYFVNKDAVGVFLFESFEQGFSLGFLVGFVIGPGGEEVGVVGKRFACFPCLVKIGNSVGIALIEQVGMAESQVGGGSGFAGM